VCVKLRDLCVLQRIPAECQKTLLLAPTNRSMTFAYSAAAAAEDAVSLEERSKMDDDDDSARISSGSNEPIVKKLDEDDDVDDDDTTTIVQRCVQRLQREGIRCVAFDMDLTAVAQHSRGRLRRDQHHLDAYLGKAVPAFVELVPALLAANIHVAVTTHSDQAEQCSNNNNIILGDELVRALLERYFAPTTGAVQQILVVAYNPRARGTLNCPHNKLKRHHMRCVREHFFANLQDKDDDSSAATTILLLDDTAAVVRDCRAHCGVRAIQVADPARGLQWSDLLRLGTRAETNEYNDHASGAAAAAAVASSCEAAL